MRSQHHTVLPPTSVVCQYMLQLRIWSQIRTLLGNVPSKQRVMFATTHSEGHVSASGSFSNPTSVNSPWRKNINIYQGRGQFFFRSTLTPHQNLIEPQQHQRQYQIHLSPSTMAPPANPPSETSEIPPLRSAVLLMLVITSSLGILPTITNVTTNDVPELLPNVFYIIWAVAYLSSIIGLTFLTLTDQTKYRKALMSHYLISMALILILCHRARTVIWMLTCSMLSAIWIRGGVAALIHEVKAVLGYLWLYLYE